MNTSKPGVARDPLERMAEKSWRQIIKYLALYCVVHRERPGTQPSTASTEDHRPALKGLSWAAAVGVGAELARAQGWL